MTIRKNGAASIGVGCIVSGTPSFAFGYYSTASGNSSLATGDHCTATGLISTAMGNYTVSSGTIATALGYATTASGDYSFSTGYRTTSSGYASTALGAYASTNGRSGSFVIGDWSTSGTQAYLNAATNNSFAARFAGGYVLYTSDGMNTGSLLAANANSWSTVSDRRKKENLVLSIGESVLREFRSLSLGSWNYIGQDASLFRHYGPMAQEWFAAFGHDGVGTIGNDTTLASADVDGVLCIAVQALEKRTAEQRVEIENLKQKNAELTARLSSFHDLQVRLASLEKLLMNKADLVEQKHASLDITR